jgi:SAM-dependent methyltransferase
MTKSKMYTTLAKYYDSQYSWKKYDEEAKYLDLVINKFKKSNGFEMLDVACGTGSHIKYFNGKYKVTGLDYNQEMLNIAKEKNPNINFFNGDMINFKIKNKFDIIVCLFSSISYLNSYSKLEKCIKNFVNHLKPGGIVIFEPFVESNLFKSVKPANFMIYEDSELKIARVNDSIKIKDKAFLKFHYLISNLNGVEYFSEEHEIMLFEKLKVIEIMKKLGFEKSTFDKVGLMPGRGLYIGRKSLN